MTFGISRKTFALFRNCFVNHSNVFIRVCVQCTMKDARCLTGIQHQGNLCDTLNSVSVQKQWMKTGMENHFECAIVQNNFHCNFDKDENHNLCMKDWKQYQKANQFKCYRQLQSFDTYTFVLKHYRRNEIVYTIYIKFIACACFIVKWSWIGSVVKIFICERCTDDSQQ